MPLEKNSLMYVSILRADYCSCLYSCYLQVILERKFFSEDDAKPLFRQIASAVNHLHR